MVPAKVVETSVGVVIQEVRASTATGLQPCAVKPPAVGVAIVVGAHVRKGEHGRGVAQLWVLRRR